MELTKFAMGLTAAMSSDTLTENNGVARSTTGSAVLNLFSLIGGSRGLFETLRPTLLQAYNENPELTAKVVFYSRDPRGGQGERDLFRENMKELIQLDPKFKQFLFYIPTYGRWDDLISLMDVAEHEVMGIILKQLNTDVRLDGRVSLLAKWLPSENTSSKKTKDLAARIRKYLELTPKQYRQMLSTLRAKIQIVESKMSANDWENIEFSAVPSNAMLIYRKAFNRHTPENFLKYMDSVTKGESKINAGVLFPYDLTRKCRGGDEDSVVEEQWKALPDYFNGVFENSIVVADVSGSMEGLPMEVSISLALYTAERNKGPWHNQFITFSRIPEMQTIYGSSLAEKVNNLRNANWSMNTDIEKVFSKILEVAILNKVDPADMIARVFIVSDMEFDSCISADVSVFQNIRKLYTQEGYNLPELVFWNVSARNTQFPMAMDERGFLNVSGCSPSVFKFTLGKTFVDAYDMMLSVLNDDRYAPITFCGENSEN